MKKRHAWASAAQETKQVEQKAPNTCLNSPDFASPKTRHLPTWASSAVARGIKRPITLPRVAFLDGGD